MQRPPLLKFRSGVTLIEMLIGVAIVGVVMAWAVPSISDLIERRRVVAAAGEIASFFAQARTESTIMTDAVSLHMEPVPESVGDHSCLRLSTAGYDDRCRCNRAEARVCSAGDGKLLREFLLPRKSVRFDVDPNTSWGFTQHVVTFRRGVYVTDVTNVRLIVKGMTTNALLHVEYNHAGRVRTCSPDGSIGGFPRC